MPETLASCLFSTNLLFYDISVQVLTQFGYWMVSDFYFSLEWNLSETWVTIKLNCVTWSNLKVFLLNPVHIQFVDLRVRHHFHCEIKYGFIEGDLNRLHTRSVLHPPRKDTPVVWSFAIISHVPSGLPAGRLPAFELGFDGNRPTCKRMSGEEHVHYASLHVLNSLQLLADKVFKSTDLTSTQSWKGHTVSLELLWVRPKSAAVIGTPANKRQGMFP